MPKLYPQTVTQAADQIPIKRKGNWQLIYITAENFINDTLNAIRVEPTIALSAQVGDIITVAIQLEHPSDKEPIDEQKAFYAYLTSDADGEVLAATAPDGGWVKGSDGAIINLVANKAGLFLTNDEGLVEFDIEESGTKSFYLVMVMPEGVVWGPIEIAFDASVSP